MSSGETKFKGIKTNSIIIDALDIAGTGDFNIPSAGSYSFKEDGTVKVAIDEGIFKTDTIAELTAATGVTIELALIKDGTIDQTAATAMATDIISELTATSGVTIDSVLMKDSMVVQTVLTLFTDIVGEVTAATGVTIDTVLFKDGGVTLTAATAFVTDIISESNATSGVTIDSALFKDGGIVQSAATAFVTDIISEVTATSGVTIDSVLMKDGGIVQSAATAFVTDIISEVTGAAGVTIDGVLFKDIEITCDKIEEKTATNGIEIADYVNFSVGPHFVVTLALDKDNETGDGTVYTIPFDTELVDKGADHAAGTFTVPADASGTYQFDVAVQLKGLVAAHEGTLSLLVTTGGAAVDAGTHILWEGQCDDETGTAGVLQSISATMLLELRVGDTVAVVLTIDGGVGGKVVDIESDYTRFSGRLVSLLTPP